MSEPHRLDPDYRKKDELDGSTRRMLSISEHLSTEKKSVSAGEKNAKSMALKNKNTLKALSGKYSHHYVDKLLRDK